MASDFDAAVALAFQAIASSKLAMHDSCYIEAHCKGTVGMKGQRVLHLALTTKTTEKNIIQCSSLLQLSRSIVEKQDLDETASVDDNQDHATDQGHASPSSCDAGLPMPFFLIHNLIELKSVNASVNVTYGMSGPWLRTTGQTCTMAQSVTANRKASFGSSSASESAMSADAGVDVWLSFVALRLLGFLDRACKYLRCVIHPGCILIYPGSTERTPHASPRTKTLPTYNLPVLSPAERGDVIPTGLGCFSEYQIHFRQIYSKTYIF